MFAPPSLNVAEFFRFNAFSVYANWAYHNPSPGNLVFEGGAHDIEPIFEYAKEIGLWVIFRPGPYINAEANAGGFPAWVTTGAYGYLRDNDTRYTEAWTPYFAKISSIVSKHTIVKGGNVILYQIENEFSSEFTDAIKKIPYYPSIHYMENLENVARENGIDIPTFTNAPNMDSKSWSKDYSNFGGEQDMYGVDSYPQVSCLQILSHISP
jgi:beta-galactosidase GanA